MRKQSEHYRTDCFRPDQVSEDLTAKCPGIGSNQMLRSPQSQMNIYFLGVRETQHHEAAYSGSSRDLYLCTKLSYLSPRRHGGGGSGESRPSPSTDLWASGAQLYGGPELNSRWERQISRTKTPAVLHTTGEIMRRR